MARSFGPLAATTLVTIAIDPSLKMIEAEALPART
jgi:hypothetical protein